MKICANTGKSQNNICANLCNIKPLLNCVNRGLTLIEVLFVILVVAVLMLPLASQFRGVRIAWETGNKRSDLFQNARIGLDKIIRELKASKQIISVTASGDPAGRIEFIDKDDNTAVFERFLFGGKSWLGYTTNGVSPSAEGDILAGPINTLVFTSFEEDAETTTTRLRAIKSVKIEMEVASDEGGISPETFTGQILIERDIISLAINEIFYNPPAGYNDNNYEYVELHNFSGFDIDVAGWQFSDNQRTDTLEGDDIWGDGSTVIPAGGYAIITDRDTLLYNELYTEIISNGGFENPDLSMWQMSGGWERKGGGHSGAWKIQRDDAGWMYQEVSIPSAGTSAFFSSWAKNKKKKRLIITVRDTGGSVLETIYDGPAGKKWTQYSTDLSAYIGTTIRIYFETFDKKYEMDDISISLSSMGSDTIRLRVDDNDIGRGLSNTGETLTLQIPGGQVVDSVTYSDSWGGDGNGFSVERIDAAADSNNPGNWAESIQTWGTPGVKNDATP